MKSYHIFDMKTPIARASNSQKRHCSRRSEISIGPDIHQSQAKGKYLECLHLQVSLLEDLFNSASYHANHNPKRILETLEICKRVAGLEKMNIINHNFNTTLKNRLGNFYCPTKGCNWSYKTAADLHVHIRKKPGNGHNILKKIINRIYCIRCMVQCNKPRDF